jgi:lantibiotic modifying enzyme
MCHPASAPSTVGISRRTLLGRSLGAAAAGVFAPALAFGDDAPPSGEGRYREAALRAARWLQSRKVAAPGGAAWSSGPDKDGPLSIDLYHGATGVVLFLLEAHQTSDDASLLRDATAGADYLLGQLDRLPEPFQAGLYTGVAGVGHVLNRAAQLTGREKYREGLAKCVRLVGAHAEKTGAGVEWGEGTDIIAGGAGVGLWLLEAARERNDPECVHLAYLAGKRLLELGRPEHGGLKWAYSVKGERLMPNFSHGTAGIGYFLATLYRWTRNQEFLDGALAGARYLKAVAQTDGGTCRIFHHEPGGTDLFYLGWCHGPTGTARFFYRLYQATGNRDWLDWVRSCAKALLDSGIPEKKTPGFWENVSLCCGTAGVADFLLHLYRLTKEPRYLAACERMADDLLRKATAEAGGLKWIQAEHRIKPELRLAHHGYMQGAAGIGSFLLRLDAFRQSKTAGPALPDCPFTEA